MTARAQSPPRRVTKNIIFPPYPARYTYYIKTVFSNLLVVCRREKGKKRVLFFFFFLTATIAATVFQRRRRRHESDDGRKKRAIFASIVAATTRLHDDGDDDDVGRPGTSRAPGRKGKPTTGGGVGGGRTRDRAPQRRQYARAHDTDKYEFL